MSLYTIHKIVCTYVPQSNDIDLKLKLKIPPKKLNKTVISSLDKLLASRHKQVFKVVNSDVVKTNLNLGFNAHYFWVAMYLKENECCFKKAHPDLVEDDVYELIINSYYM